MLLQQNMNELSVSVTGKLIQYDEKTKLTLTISNPHYIFFVISFGSWSIFWATDYHYCRLHMTLPLGFKTRLVLSPAPFLHAVILRVTSDL